MPGAKPYGQLQYKQVNGKRMAYIDEGQGDAIVFQHGNPTSSYLWRNVMPHLEGLGRLVACDLIGMGGSDKLDDSGPDRYHYAEQRDYLFKLWDELELGDRVILRPARLGFGAGLRLGQPAPRPGGGHRVHGSHCDAHRLVRLPGARARGFSGLPLARGRGNGAGEEHVRRGGAARLHPAQTDRRGDGPLPRAVPQCRRGSAADVVMATQHPDRG